MARGSKVNGGMRKARRRAGGMLRGGLGILLIPLAWAVSAGLAAVLRGLWPPRLSGLPLPAWLLAWGAIAWLAVYLLLPRPVRAYVFAHELTHALWALAFGGRVGRIRVTARGGSARVSKSNVWITLGPYFSPLYTLVVIALYGVVFLFADPRPWAPVAAALIGFTWAFHVTFTLSALAEHQPDVAEYGRLLSYTLIYTLNVGSVALWLVAVSPATLAGFGAASGGALGQAAAWAGGAVSAAGRQAQAIMRGAGSLF